MATIVITRISKILLVKSSKHFGDIPFKQSMNAVHFVAIKNMGNVELIRKYAYKTKI